MGRHSVPDNGPQLDSDSPLALETELALDTARPSGRHAQHADGAVSGSAPSAAHAGPERPKPMRGTAADLALIRAHADVRARCAAAVVVPFVLFTAVLLAIGNAGQYLIWIWIPLVTAGVLVGSFLDHGHKRHG